MQVCRKTSAAGLHYPCCVRPSHLAAWLRIVCLSLSLLPPAPPDLSRQHSPSRSLSPALSCAGPGRDRPAAAAEHTNPTVDFCLVISVDQGTHSMVNTIPRFLQLVATGIEWELGEAGNILYEVTGFTQFATCCTHDQMCRNLVSTSDLESEGF